MEPDWSTLRRLRAGFLAGTAGSDDYWRSFADLAQYDATFAQRIGWKWDFVLADLRQLGWQPPAGIVLDWGCGSGVASRAFLDHFGHATARELWLNDRSSLAVQFAAERATAKYPNLPVHRGVPERFDLLIVSHVLTELAPSQVEELANLARRATAVLWVEPGTYETSLTLIAIRERLRAGSDSESTPSHPEPDSASPAQQAPSPPLYGEENSPDFVRALRPVTEVPPLPPCGHPLPLGGEERRGEGAFQLASSMPVTGQGRGEDAPDDPFLAAGQSAVGFNVVAPCPHQARCGVLAAGNESHWCHQFASPPEFVFTDAFWTAFSRTMEIDLRSLPLSYLVLDRRPVPKLPPTTVRMLGRPELFKPHASILGCTEAGLIEGILMKREHPEEYRHFKKGRAPSLQSWEREGPRIKSWKPHGDGAPSIARHLSETNGPSTNENTLLPHSNPQGENSAM